MDLIPRPDQVVSAAANLAHKLVYGGLADLRPMPRTLIDRGELREVHHYRPRSGAPAHRDPVLLVAPLAAPSTCFDLRRGCSLVEHLVQSGRPTYLVDYGEAPLADGHRGLEHWVDEVVPRAVEEVSRHAGSGSVHVVGWSLGAVLALLTAADRPDLPIGSLAVLGAPLDVTKVPLRTRRGFGPSVGRLVTRPFAVAWRLHDADFLAQLEAVDRFAADLVGSPGRSFGQLYHRLLEGTRLAGGSYAIGDRTVSLADVTVPLLVVAGASDQVVPVAAVRPVVDLAAGVEDLRFEVVPGGHLGMLTGRAARTTTWRILDEWSDAHSSTAHSSTAHSDRAGTPATATIGSNPRRRYGSASSRSLVAR
jgi:polyhydroxyalkanoate synthase